MKKKPSIREMRNQKVQGTKAAYQQAEAKRNEIIKKEKEAREAATKEKERARKAAELNSDLNPVHHRVLSEVKKSSAKAAGLKSSFTIGDKRILMTSFGRGNSAVIEKNIQNGIVEDLAEKPAFSVQSDEIRFRIDGRVKDATHDNPLHRSDEAVTVRREDMIHARDALEKLYYGENFEDNIHIQAIYSILDIEKILSIHVNNIIYMLNNFLRTPGEDLEDVIGNLHGISDTYEKFLASEKKNPDMVSAFRKLCKARQLGYLNLQIIPSEAPKDKNGRSLKTKSDPNAVKLSEEEFYYMVSSLSEMRHMLAHGKPKQNIYKIEGFGKGNAVSVVLNRLYSERIRELNFNFLDKAAKNLVILFQAFSIREKQEKASFARDYYDFVVRKTHRNMGFSVKILREHMTADLEEASVLRHQKYDSVRGKLYPFVDFAIFRYYKGKPQEAADLVGSLRASFTEKEKDEIYRKEAARIWPEKQVGDLILQHILPHMSGDEIKTIRPDPDISADMLQDIMLSTEATDFTKMIYMITLFINGKEINDLLTTLIHQFENIAAFTEVIKSQGLRSGFAADFKLFGLSGKVASELRAVNSFARMSKESVFAKEAMYEEAFRILGMKADEEQLKREVKDMLDPEKSAKGTQRRGLRNFIANNVIESVRFKYLVRYGNVNKLKGLAESSAVVSFVLKDIPDDQILRYYAAIGEDRATDPQAARAELTRRLTGFSFENIRDVRQNDKEANREEQIEKQQKQALVRLYLAVLYLAMKNLVYINSRYFLAFHCVERDRLLLNPEYWKNADQHKSDPAYGLEAFAREFLEQHPPKARVKAYLLQNFSNSDPWAIRTFRNKVEHLDAIRNADLYLKDISEVHSWYALYHYIMQRRIRDQFDYDSGHESKRNPGKMIISEEELNPKTIHYFKLVETYHSYCKDFVKALNVPFAYNLARYKNLSIDELFDKNHPGEKGSGKLPDKEETDSHQGEKAMNPKIL